MTAARTLFAPGKLFVLGEWAVLERGPALLTPVPAGQQATVTPLPQAPGLLEIRSPGFSPHPRRWCWGPRGWEEQPGPGWGEGLDVVGAVVGRGSRELAPPTQGLLVEIAAQGMFMGQPGAGGQKLGFGSSAAVAALVARALGEGASEGALLRVALGGHRDAQRGRGSGADVATSLWGRCLTYRLPVAVGLAPAPGLELEPEVEAAPAPQGLGMLAVWTGRSADTRALMGAMVGFKQGDPVGYRAAMERVAEASACGIGAWRAGDVAGVLGAARRGGFALASLGRAAGVEVEIEAHRALGRALEEVCGPQEAAWKPSGAGGGDLALVLTAHEQAQERARAHLEASGYPCIPLV